MRSATNIRDGHPGPPLAGYPGPRPLGRLPNCLSPRTTKCGDSPESFSSQKAAGCFRVCAPASKLSRQATVVPHANDRTRRLRLFSRRFLVPARCTDPIALLCRISRWVTPFLLSLVASHTRCLSPRELFQKLYIDSDSEVTSSRGQVQTAVARALSRARRPQRCARIRPYRRLEQLHAGHASLGPGDP